MTTKFLYFILIYIYLLSLPVFHCEISINRASSDGAGQLCICLPYWQCRDNYTGLSDFVTNVADVRSFSHQDNSARQLCSNQFDICCKIECGRRRLSNYAADEYGFGISSSSPLLKTRILGGENEAEFGEFPWMVGILKDDAFQCGGSLIHPRVALTAAHCVYKKSGSFKIRAGEWDWQSESENTKHQDRFVNMVIIHQKFDLVTVKNDISLLVVEEPFELTHTVGVVCIPPTNIDYGNVECVASGWGTSTYYGGGLETILRKTYLPLIDRDKCTSALQKARLGPHFSLDESFICAGGEENKDTCKGDGGSPLVCPIHDEDDRYEQVGIVSWGLKCGLRNTPGVYVNVKLFNSWIDSHMKNLGYDTNIYRYQH